MKTSNIFLVSTQLKQKPPETSNRKLIFTPLFKMSADERYSSIIQGILKPRIGHRVRIRVRLRAGLRVALRVDL